MQVTKYYCDKCKKEVGSNTDLKQLAICERSASSYSWCEKLELSLCSSCCEKLGLIKRVIKDGKIVEETQDIKDKWFDVMVELIEELGLHGEH